MIATLALVSTLESYTLPLTRGGQTKTCVAYDAWSGEYPLPVIDVASKTKGTTTIKAYKSVRKLDATVPCTIENGIYHPWAKAPKSLVKLYTLAGLREYEALKPFTLEDQKLAKGDRITELVYLAEGFCKAKVKGKPVELECGAVEDKTKTKRLAQPCGDDFSEQWVHLSCSEGYKAFVQDTEILKQPGVKPGEMLGFGAVGPAK